ALRGVFETGLHVNAVDPEGDVAFGREIALAPARVLLGPGLLEASNGRGREPAASLPSNAISASAKSPVEKPLRERIGISPSRLFDRRAEGGRIADEKRMRSQPTFAAAVTPPRAAHSDRTDAGHDLTLGQMSVAHQPPAAIIGELIGMAAEQARNLGLDRLRQNRSRAVAQNLGQRIGKKFL